MLAKQIDQMFNKMEEAESANKNAETDGTAGAAACLRYDSEQLSTKNPCLRCTKSVFFAKPKSQGKMGADGKWIQLKFEWWPLTLVGCGAYISVEQIEKFGEFFFCSAEQVSDEGGGGFALDGEERLALQGMESQGETQTPRQRGDRQGE